MGLAPDLIINTMPVEFYSGYGYGGYGGFGNDDFGFDDFGDDDFDGFGSRRHNRHGHGRKHDRKHDHRRHHRYGSPLLYRERCICWTCKDFLLKSRVGFIQKVHAYG